MISALTPRVLVLLVGAGFVALGACSSDSSAPPDGVDGGDAATVDSGSPDSGAVEDADAAPTPDAMPPAAPTFVSFTDRDPRRGFSDGTIAIGRASDESAVSGYRAYWSDATGARLGLAGSVVKSAADLSVVVPPGTILPAGATLVTAVAVAGALESTGVSSKGDNFPLHFDLSVGIQGQDGLGYPRILVDAAAGKMLVVGVSYGRPELRRCNLDGTACTAHALDAGRGIQTASTLAATIDPIGSKLLVVTADATNSDKPALFRCNLDGTGCTYTDISAGSIASSGERLSIAVDATSQKLVVVGQSHLSLTPTLIRCNLDGTGCVVPSGPSQSTWWPFVLVDAAGGKLLVVGSSTPNQGRPVLHRCDLDGTGCVVVDISAGQGSNSGDHASAVVDVLNAKLLVVTQNTGNGNRPSLFRCDLDGSNCTHTDLSAGLGVTNGTDPRVAIDAKNAKLDVVVTGGGLYRCNLDGSACVYVDYRPSATGARASPDFAIDAQADRLLFVANVLDAGPSVIRTALDGSSPSTLDISAGPGGGLATSISGIVDATNRKLLTVTTAAARGGKPWLFRCDLDGTGCTDADLSAGRGVGTANKPAVAIDRANGKLLVVLQDPSNQNKTSLFRCNLDGSACTWADVSAGQPANSGRRPAIALDMTTQKTFIVSTNEANQNILALSTCALDGSACVHEDVATQPSAEPALALGGGKLLVVTSSSGSANPWLYRISLDGTQWQGAPLAIHPTTVASHPSVLVDGTKLVVVATSSTANESRPVLFRCELDGTACIVADISAGQHPDAGLYPTVAIANGKLFVTTRDNRGQTVALYTCGVDGSACSYADLSEGRRGAAGPIALLDPFAGRLLTVFVDGDNRGRPGLYRLDLW